MVMASDLKQRIIGMVVLIFLALIILPWLLGRNQPTITKPLPKFKTPIASSLHMTEINGSKLANIENVIVHTQASAIKMEPRRVERAERAVVKVEPQQKVELQPIENKPQVIGLEKPDLTAIKITVKDSPNKAIAGNKKHLIIQLGSFSNQANVNKLVKELKAKKFPVYMRPSQTEGITHIFVGPFLHQYEAREKIKQIEKLTKIHGMVIKSSTNAFSHPPESGNSPHYAKRSKRSRL
jgi:cell division septation protein DedD